MDKENLEPTEVQDDEPKHYELIGESCDMSTLKEPVDPAEDEK